MTGLPLAPHCSRHFVGKLAHHLSLFSLGVVPLLWLISTLSLGCGEDAEQTYAGLSVATASARDGLSYRVRFLSPPWKQAKHDPLVLGMDPDIELRGKDDQLFIPGTAVVLQIERESILSDNTRNAKYRFEATLLDCDIALNARERCAERMAVADNDARTAQGEPSFYEGSIKTSTNDFDQKYYQLITRGVDTLRSKRIAFYETPDPQRYLRVYIEANPRLDEAEVDRMLNAVETFADESLAWQADGGAEP